ncbi:uncharacterized protein TNCV_894781 [Trichonephila clavipes]|nr:uncharacterized protein TNCV_894781 [Trichonephila clavipes]
MEAVHAHTYKKWTHAGKSNSSIGNMEVGATAFCTTLNPPVVQETEIETRLAYHCSRRKQKPTSDINKALTGGAQRTSLNQSPGDQSRGFSTVDSHWLGTRACARSAYDQSTLPIDVQVFHCKDRDPHVETWRVGCHLSCPPRHSTEVPNHTVYERRVRYIILLICNNFPLGCWIFIRVIS